MPMPTDLSNVYAAAGPNMLSAAVQGHRELVYVPNSVSDDVSVIDPKTFQVIDRFAGGDEPQHVVPSYDLRTLYAIADQVPAGTLTPIDPTTGRPGAPIDVQDPYNMYYTPDGKFAIVVAEYYKRLDFYDPQSWQRINSLQINECAGINHADFTVDGKYALFTCEFANRMVVVDVAAQQHIRSFELHQVHNGMPQDCRLAPDGKTFYVADMHANGVYTFDAALTTQTGFIPTGRGAHGIYFSRDGKQMYVANRNEGSVSVLDPATGAEITKWHIPGGGSPDMGGVSADGSVLWLSGRYHGEVYAISTADGKLLARIPVGAGPHGLLVWPQPGRYSLGHTGNIR